MVLKFFRKQLSNFSHALQKTRGALRSRLQQLFSGGFDRANLDDLEELLYEADLGVETAGLLTDRIAILAKKQPSLSMEQLTEELQKALIEMLPEEQSLACSSDGPTVILVVGVNGNGKTTSIARLAQRLKSEGKNVLVGAADTFRAAAVEQLDNWAQRLGVDIVRGKAKADPSSVVYDAVTAAIARKTDVLLLDTAGRLQSKEDLMKELEKMRRSCAKVLPGAPHETLLVVDASTGQNAIDQARTFSKYVPLTGLILTKLDGTAKGGVAIAIGRELSIPIKFIGTGEGAEDMEPFDPELYVTALLGSA